MEFEQGFDDKATLLVNMLSSYLRRTLSDAQNCYQTLTDPQWAALHNVKLFSVIVIQLLHLTFVSSASCLHWVRALPGSVYARSRLQLCVMRFLSSSEAAAVAARIEVIVAHFLRRSVPTASPSAAVSMPWMPSFSSSSVCAKLRSSFWSMRLRTAKRSKAGARMCEQKKKSWLWMAGRRARASQFPSSASMCSRAANRRQLRWSLLYCDVVQKPASVEEFELLYYLFDLT